MNWLLLKNSLVVAALTSIGSIGIGFVAALWVSGLAPKFRRSVVAAAAATLAIPPFLAANSWMHWLGQTGVWRAWLPLNIYSIGGTIWILTLLTWPLGLFFVLGAWRRLDVNQLECDVRLRSWRFVRFLLWPLARTSVGLTLALTFVLAFNNFAVPALLQVKVFPAELWVSFNTTFNYRAALQLSWPMIVAPLVLLLWFRRKQIQWPAVDRLVSAAAFRQQLGHICWWMAGGITLPVLFCALGLPLWQLLGSDRTWRELWPALAAGRMAFWNSLTWAMLTATTCSAVALLIWRWKGQSVSWLLFMMPGVFLGIALLFLLNRPWLDFVSRGSSIVVIAFTLRYLALSWTSASQAMRSLDPDLTAAARLEGAWRWQVFRRIQWPQVLPQFAASWYVVYLLSLWDVETLICIVPPGGETLSLRVFNLLHYGHNYQVNALCVWLVVLALVPWAAWQAYAFCGVRPSSGADTTKSAAGSEPSIAMKPAEFAAPEDGRNAFWRTVPSLRMRSARFGVLCVLPLFATNGCSQPSANSISIQSAFFSAVQIIGSRGTALGQFNKPRSVAVDALDNLYVVDLTGRVQKFSSEGVYLSSWQMQETDLGRPKGMCRDHSGNIVVVEPHYSRVNHFSPEGRLISQWGVHGTNVGQFVLPRAVAVDSRGFLYVSEYGARERVQKFSPGGVQVLCAIGHAGIGEAEFNRPEGLGIDSRDRLYVADSCNHRVQVFAADGKFLRSFGKAGQGTNEFSYPYDVQVDTAGRQFVCEFGNSRIQIFDELGRSVEILGRTGAAPGQFNNPWSIALDSQENLYVADSQNHRVQKFIRKPGAKVSVAQVFNLSVSREIVARCRDLLVGRDSWRAAEAARECSLTPVSAPEDARPTFWSWRRRAAPHRRFPIGTALAASGMPEFAEILQVANLRYRRQQVCATGRAISGACSNALPIF